MAKRRYSRYIPLIFLLADIISLNAAFVLSNFVKFERTFYISETYVALQIMLNVIWIIVFHIIRLQEVDREELLLHLFAKVVRGIVISFTLVFSIWVATAKPFHYSREHLLYIGLFFSIFIFGWRTVWFFVIRYYRAQGYNLRKFIMVGRGELSVDLVQYFRRNPGIGYEFLGYFDNRPEGSDGVVGGINQIKDFVRERKVDVIFCYHPKIILDEIRGIIDFAENNLMKVKILTELSALGNRDFSIQKYGAIPIVNVSPIPLDSKVNRVIKRAFDIVFSGIIILGLLTWLIPLMALLIRLESRGPVFFIQRRNGLGNKPFSILKFRTMRLHYDAEVKQATRHDRRITRVGSFLRKTSIDELPQFLNVFMGDMSVVGPRPHAINHNIEFRKKIDRFVQRHEVKPGITGLAQAKGYRGETSKFSDISGRVKLDRFYVKKWSLLLDLRIIALTIISIIRGSRKAY